MGNKEEMKMLVNAVVRNGALILSMLVEAEGDVSSREYQGSLGTPLEDHPHLGVIVFIGEVGKALNIKP